jgi:hypothetical protein
MITAIYARKSTDQAGAGGQLMARRGDGLENWITTCALLLILVTASEAGAELTVQGWLDFYEGRTKLPADVGKIVAASYVLGLADGAIALKVMSCPKDYLPDGGALARQTARVIGKSRGHPALSVTAAVLVALVGDGCKQSGGTDGPPR